MRKSFKVTVLVVVILLAGGLSWFSIVVRRSDMGIGATWVLYHLLEPYLTAHGGDLPDGLAELQAHYDKPVHISRAEWFDIAWGIKAHEIDGDGMVRTRGRFLVEASEEAPDWFRPHTERMSGMLAQIVVRIRSEKVSTVSTTQSEQANGNK